MPLVEVNLAKEVLTNEQKTKVAKSIGEALVKTLGEELNVDVSKNVWVIIHEHDAAGNWFIGGEPVSEALKKYPAYER